MSRNNIPARHEIKCDVCGVFRDVDGIGNVPSGWGNVRVEQFYDGAMGRKIHLDLCDACVDRAVDHIRALARKGKL